MGADGAVGGSPRTPECLLGGLGQRTPTTLPGHPYLSILSQSSDGFFTTAGMAGTGAPLGPSVAQGSLRGQHSPSPDSAQRAGSLSRVSPTCTRILGAPGRGGDRLPPLSPFSPQGIPLLPRGSGGLTGVVVHQVVQAGEGEPRRDVQPAVLQAVDAVVCHRVPGAVLAAAHRQRVAACRGAGTWRGCRDSRPAAPASAVPLPRSGAQQQPAPRSAASC